MRKLLFLVILFFPLEAWVGSTNYGEYSDKDNLVTVLYGNLSSVDASPEVLAKLAKESASNERKAEEIYKHLDRYFRDLRQKYRGNLLPCPPMSTYDSHVDPNDEGGVRAYQKAGKPSQVYFQLGSFVVVVLNFKTLPDYKILNELNQHLIEEYKKF